MLANRQYGSEGGVGESRSRPLSRWDGAGGWAVDQGPPLQGAVAKRIAPFHGKTVLNARNLQPVGWSLVEPEGRSLALQQLPSGTEGDGAISSPLPMRQAASPTHRLLQPRNIVDRCADRSIF